MKVAVPIAAPPPGAAGGRAGGAGLRRSFYTVPAQREITIKDLLTHVSGLGSGPMGNSDIEKVARKDGETLADYIPRLGPHRARIPARLALDLQPRRRLRDARPHDRDRVRHAARSVLPHAHLRSARHEGHHVLADRRADAASGHRLRSRTPNGLTKTAMPNDTMSRNVYFRGSGGLYSTAEDYIPLGMMLANGGELNGKRLLSRKTVEMMSAAHVHRHAAGPARRRRLRPQRARRHQSRRARHDAVRRHVRLDGRAGHTLLRRSEGGAGRRADGADVEW